MLTRIGLMTLGLTLLSAVFVVGVANHARNSRMQQTLQELSAQEVIPVAPDAAALAALPEPVQRYLRMAIPAGHRPVRYAEVTQQGQFRTDLEGRWMPMTARQYVYTARPAFVWDANVRMWPGLTMKVMDSYHDRQGGVDARLLGALPVVRMGGSRVTEAALQRYLAEAPWLPTALWPSKWLRWEPIDATHARAIASDGHVHAQVVFTFDTQGHIVGMEAQRYRDVDGRQVLTPWVGQFSNYLPFDGLVVPASGEVSWRINGLAHPYVRVRVTDIHFRSH